MIFGADAEHDARLSAEVGDALAESSAHEGGARWDEAIVAAERRLAKGDYGLCEACGEAIDFARLEAQPAASRCLRCQETSEKRRGPAGFAG